MSYEHGCSPGSPADRNLFLPATPPTPRLKAKGFCCQVLQSCRVISLKNSDQQSPYRSSNLPLPRDAPYIFDLKHASRRLGLVFKAFIYNKMPITAIISIAHALARTVKPGADLSRRRRYHSFQILFDGLSNVFFVGVFMWNYNIDTIWGLWKVRFISSSHMFC